MIIITIILVELSSA